MKKQLLKMEIAILFCFRKLFRIASFFSTTFFFEEKEGKQEQEHADLSIEKFLYIKNKKSQIAGHLAN